MITGKHFPSLEGACRLCFEFCRHIIGELQKKGLPWQSIQEENEMKVDAVAIEGTGVEIWDFVRECETVEEYFDVNLALEKYQEKMTRNGMYWAAIEGDAYLYFPKISPLVEEGPSPTMLSLSEIEAKTLLTEELFKFALDQLGTEAASMDACAEYVERNFQSSLEAYYAN